MWKQGTFHKGWIYPKCFSLFFFAIPLFIFKLITALWILIYAERGNSTVIYEWKTPALSLGDHVTNLHLKLTFMIKLLENPQECVRSECCVPWLQRSFPTRCAVAGKKLKPGFMSKYDVTSSTVCASPQHCGTDSTHSCEMAVLAN